MELTDEGRILLDMVLPLVAGSRPLNGSLLRTAKTGGRNLVVAAPASVLANELAQPIQKYRKMVPRQLSFVDRPSHERPKSSWKRPRDMAFIMIQGRTAARRRWNMSRVFATLLLR